MQEKGEGTGDLDQQKSTSSDLWAPTPHQMRLLDVAAECALQKTISAMCIEAEISRAAFYKWMKEDAGFKAAWEEAPRKLLDSHIPGVYSALLRKAHDGDVAAIKIVLELHGQYKPIQRHEITGKDGKPIQTEHSQKPDLTQLTDHELASYRAVLAKLTGRGGTGVPQNGSGNLPPISN